MIIHVNVDRKNICWHKQLVLKCVVAFSCRWEDEIHLLPWLHQKHWRGLAVNDCQLQRKHHQQVLHPRKLRVLKTRKLQSSNLLEFQFKLLCLKRSKLLIAKSCGNFNLEVNFLSSHTIKFACSGKGVVWNAHIVMIEVGFITKYHEVN